MSGGIIVAKQIKEDHTMVAVRDDGNYIAIDIEHSDRCGKIKCGDSIWWHGFDAYWSSTDSDVEVKLKKRGYSYAYRPPF